MKKSLLHLFIAFFLVTPSLLSAQESTAQELTPKSLTFSLEHKQALEQRLADFTQTHLAALQPEELQYLTNLIYFSYATASLDVHVRGKAQEILICAKAIQAGLLNYTQTIQIGIKEHLVKTLNTIDGAVTAQMAHLRAWEFCCEAEEALLPHNASLAKAIDAFKEIITFELGLWTEANTELFDTQLEQSATIFIEAGESLTMVGNTHKALRHNKSPLPSIPENRQIAKIGTASRAARSVDEQCWKSIDAAFQITETEAALQVLSIAVVGMYYQAAYKLLAQHPAQYRTFMYNEQGLIPVEKRTQELPVMQ